MSSGNCRSCGASIVWVVLRGSGKPHPCDPGMLTVVTDVGQIVKGRGSHFATCPKADDFRRMKQA